MYTQELTIEIKSNFDKDKLVEDFQILLGSFNQSGQSQTDKTSLFITGNFLKCTISTLEKNSLDKKYNTEWVTAELERVEKLFSSKLKVKTLGKTYENYSGSCTCKKRSFLILYTHMFNDAGALDCGTCFKPIPLYRMPQLDPKMRYSILSWEQNYISCDTLQINCRVGERWATKQMTDYKSELSKQGIEICSEIRTLTGIPTFYYLFNYRKLRIEKDKQRPCPSCGGQWLLDKKLHKFYDFKCDRCELISSITSNG